MENPQCQQENRKKNLTIILCIIGYFVSYLCRTNLSVALEDLSLELGISNQQAGMVGSMYFWTYAFGQLVAGWLCLKTKPKNVVLIGLALTCAANFLIGTITGYSQLLILWTFNGFAAAMFWPPIFQIATNWCEPEEYVRISVLLNLPTTVGFMIAWGGLGLLNHYMPWKWMFWIPAIVAAVFAGVWVWGCHPKENPEMYHGKSRTEKKPASRVCCRWITGSMVGFACIVIVQGSIKESINLWAPTLMKDVSGDSSPVMISAFTAMIPLFSTIGLMATGYLTSALHNRQEHTMMLLLAVGVCFGFLLVSHHDHLVGMAICLGGLLAVVYGVNTLITTLLPLRFSDTGQVGMVSSVFNFLSYLGAALGGVISGMVSDFCGWSAMYRLWAGLSVIAIIVLTAIMSAGNHKNKFKML